MPWHDLSFHFRQAYEGGYLYLDNCGKFMRAAEGLNFIPKTAIPSGASMEIPDIGVNADINASYAALSQELPQGEPSAFYELADKVATLYKEHFTPKGVLRNGFSAKAYWQFGDSEEALKATLKIGHESQDDFAKLVEMVPSHKKFEFNFRSGSKLLRVMLEAVNFQRPLIPRRNAELWPNRVERSAVEKFNKFAERAPTGLAHAVVLDVDLIENDPPASSSLDGHFKRLLELRERLKSRFDLT
jgi:hypothetical protein